jgi:hypothetical protein
LEEQLGVLQFQLLFDLNDNLRKLFSHLLHVGLNNFVAQILDMLLTLEYKNQMNLYQSLKQLKDF